MRKTLVFLCVLGISALAGPIRADVTTNWDSGGGADQSWFNPDNWDNGVPTSADKARITDGGTAVIDAAGAVARHLDYMGPGTLIIGETDSAASLTTGSWFFIKSGGTVNLLDGTNKVNRLFKVESGGTYNLQGGTFDGNLGHDTWTYPVDIQGMFDQTGGYAKFDGKGKQPYFYIRSAGRYRISGGTLYVLGGYGDEGYSRFQVDGIFQVSGSGAAGIQIGRLDRSVVDVYSQSGTLLAEIDSGTSAEGNAGITHIKVHNDSNVATAVFESGSILDVNLLDGFVPADGQYFRLLTADSITNDGLNLAAGDETLWTITWSGDDGGGNPTELGITYVPEPATLVLLGLGGLAVLRRRRKNRDANLFSV